MKLSIIIPTYNEEKTIENIVSLVQSVKYPVEHEIIIVDDGSAVDLSGKAFLTASGNIRLYKNPVNRGKGFCIREGIEKAEGDILIIQDADSEYDPRDIPKLLIPILENEVRVVYGSRFMDNPYPSKMSLASWLANIFLTWLTNVLYGLQLTDMETCYKVFRIEDIKKFQLREDRFAFEPEVTAVLAKRGLKVKELAVSYRGRARKEGKKIKAKDFVAAIFTLLGNLNRKTQ